MYQGFGDARLHRVWEGSIPFVSTVPGITTSCQIPGAAHFRAGHDVKLNSLNENTSRH